MRVFQQKGCKAWRVRFWVDGRQFDKPLSTRNKEVALTRAREMVLEFEREAAGLLSPKVERETAKAPLDELLEDWVENGLSPDVSKMHRTYSRNRPLKVINECGWKFVRDVTAQSFESWRAKCRKAGLSPKTLNEYLSHLRSFLGWMEERGMIGFNPLKPVKLLNKVKTDAHRAFTIEELQALVSSVPEYRACLYRVAAFTGLRRNELKTLTWNRVDLESEFPQIDLEPEKTKNKKGGRLPIHPDALIALKSLRASAPDDSTLVFYNGITKMPRYRKDLALAGIAELDSLGRGVEFHTFRRSWATLLAQSGVSERMRMEFMRHSSVQQVEVYTDGNHLPMREELKKVATLSSSPIASLKTGKTCPSVSKAGKSAKKVESAGIPLVERIGGFLSTCDHPCLETKMAGQQGFEPWIQKWVFGDVRWCS